MAKPVQVEDEEFKWFLSQDKSFTVVVFNNHDLDIRFTAENAQSLKEQTQSEEWKMAINGGYFAGSLISATPIGGLSIRGEVLTEVVNDSQNQITQVVIFDHEQLKLNIVPLSQFSSSAYADSRYSYFQTGPLVLKDNQLQSTQIKDSINGVDKYLRAVVGITDKGEIVLGVSRIAMSLEEFANKLLSVETLADRKVTLVNLDGGSSTAIFSPELDQFNFGENKRLPYVIGVKP